MQSRALRTAVADKAVSTLFAAGLAIGFVLVAPFVPIAAKAGPAIATESYAQAQHDEKKEAPGAAEARNAAKICTASFGSPASCPAAVCSPASRPATSRSAASSPATFGSPASGAAKVGSACR